MSSSSLQRIFDTHCHYNLEPLVNNWQEYWIQAQTAGIKKTLIAGSDLEKSRIALEISEQDENLGVALGIHPTDFLEKNETKAPIKATSILEKYEADIAEMKRWTGARIWAIGECGLEYFRLHERTDFAEIQKVQRQLLDWQIAWALKVNKTLVFHLRDETDRVYEEILTKIKKIDDQTNMVLHCVGGSTNFVKTALENPRIYVSFAGNVTFKNAQNLRDLVPLVPKNRLLIETDAPFLTPAPKRGQFPCQPADITLTGKFLADQLNIDLDQVYENSLEVYNLQ